ncbi:MAG TPA: alanine racemase, partial [Thermodesulfovibrionales bacterium]|nr:alanine racemase [Thermodesulfovibrionales bacterium]
MHRGAVADIDLDALSHNLNVVRTLSGDRGVIAVVKADAYGHGALGVSGRLEAEGISCLAVAYTEEALTLRSGGIHSPILVLFDKTDGTEFFEYNLIPVIYDLDSAVRFSEEARRRNRPLDVHVKVDTGMGRLGLNSENVLDDILAISKMDSLNIAGLMSHFSDTCFGGDSIAGEQLRKFVALRERLLP